MPRLFVHFTFFFFTLTALSGVWMRFVPFNPTSSIPYTNVLHGHSHLAILGWAFLGAFIIFLSVYWRTIRQRNQAIALTMMLFFTSLLMFAAFLYQGYGIISIVMSSIHIFVEYWAAVFIIRQLKIQNEVPKSGLLFIKASLLTLVISSFGPFSLGYISANGMKDSIFFDVAIYFYLHFQYNGWLYLFLVGMFIILVHSKNIFIQSSYITYGFWFYMLSLFPGYFSSILWVDLGEFGMILAAIGSIGQWIGVIFTLAAFKTIWGELARHLSKFTITCLYITFLLLFFKSTMELGLISPTLANLIYDTRSIVIGYLHFTLLGFVSIFILAQYQMLNIITTKWLSILGFSIFFAGFLLNKLLLFGQGLFQWLDFPRLTFDTGGLLLASGLLLIGILILWLSFFQKNNNRIVNH
ncbi:hypothetical protein [Cytobacillus praedii]|uniref:Uncharacterized protein n=1 Tax=Cytobacillus praedii TaxID=1742358 RepID=A0A4R1AZK9_9BACI|nr:hypothetical protein [Cytobacillus praedii]TCJ02816.1 hypothetical protein E0Y62_17585 [Cytobacillus praedii]